ncbi:unnamed protein product [Owenia fusiformis]|uniref:B box-type domain-containing protein n=1 Tax=Owenia fusiformis TaxID=6347 RepID=A0A8S4P856_OWEFU|nr:unnamed protein product [Owenia fusiformis]
MFTGLTMATSSDIDEESYKEVIWIKKTDKPKCPCPVCNELFEVPQHGAKGLKGNYILNGMLEILQRKLRKESPLVETINCDICIKEDETLKAEFRCIDCAQNICKHCKRAHNSIKAVKSHKVIPITGDENVDSKMILDSMSQRSKFCPDHPEEQLKFYCKSCMVVLCMHCCVTTHSGHKCEELAKTAKSDINQIETLIKLYIEQENEFDMAIKQQSQHRKDELTKAEIVKTQIEASRKAHIDNVNRHYEDQTLKIQTHIKVLNSDIDKLELEKGIMMSTRNALNAQKQYGHPADIIQMRKDVAKKIQDLTKLLKQSKSEELNEHQTIMTFAEGKICKESSTYGIVKILPNMRSELLFDTDEVYNLNDVAISKNGWIVIAEGKNLHFHNSKTLQREYLGRDINCSRMCFSENGIFGITKDTNKIFLINKSQITQVKIPELATNNDCSIAKRTQANHIIVANNNGCISIVDYKKKSIVSSFKHEHITDWIATNSQDHIILSDWHGSIVYCIDAKGYNIFKYGQNHPTKYNLYHPAGVCVDKYNNIVIASYGSNSVHLINSSGHFIKEIVKVKNPKVVAIDNEGKLVLLTGEGKIHIIEYQ